MTTPEKVDLYKLHKAEYAATKKPRLVTIGNAGYLAVDGCGAPGSDAYTRAIGAIYSVGYTLKFASKADGRDFVVCKLEALYGTGNPVDPMKPDDWTWRLMIRLPEFIDSTQLDSAKKKVLAKGECTAAADVHRVELEPGPCVQMLHLGPYTDEEQTIEVMREFAGAEGHILSGVHHEIYLSDPRRVEPAKLKTILRLPVACE